MKTNSMLEKLSFKAVAVLIGIVVCIITFAFSCRSDLVNAEKHISSIINYIGNQCAAYNVTNLSSETRSLLRIMEGVQQVNRNIAYDRREIPEEELLKQYAEELYLTGIVILNSKGEVEAKYLSDELTIEDLKPYLEKETVLNVAEYPQKNYASRNVLPNDSFLDLSTEGCIGVKGVIAAYYHTRNDYIGTYTLTFQNLLEGYTLERDGIVAITKGNVIVASNKEDLVNKNVDDVPVLREIEGNEEEHIVNVKDAGRRGLPHYFGMLNRGRDYYVYAYMPEREVFETTPRNMLIVLILYILVVMLIQLMRWKSLQGYQQVQIKQEKQYQKKLVEAAKQAEAANAAKTVFLQRMSHDIRTPINGILGLIEIGEYYSDDLEKQEECRDKIRESSKLLLDLVNEVLDMGKLESGEIFLEERPFNLLQLMDETVGSANRSAKERGITIYRGEWDIPHPCLVGSSLYLKRLQMNILTNAVKYNKENGEIHLSCKEILCEEDEVWIEFICADTGIGMSEEFKKHIFEPFTQEEMNARSHYGGSGLGMSIAKSLVDKMGGKIRFESKQDVGTTFYITIPFKICQAPILTEMEEEEKSISLQGMHILVAEDNELNMEIAEFLLESNGASVTKAYDGKEAVDIFAGSPVGGFDVILMDIMMPNLDGYQACREIRELPRVDAKRIPIIAMTANAFTEDRQKAYDCGMNEHLAKPLDGKKLLETVSKYYK